MARKQAHGNNPNSYFGRVLVMLGLAALGADLAFLAHPLLHLLESARVGLLGLVPALGMSLLNATRAIAFHQVDYFSLVSRILVLFSAFVAVVVGAVLRNAPRASAAAPDGRNLPGPSEGDR